MQSQIKASLRQSYNANAADRESSDIQPWKPRQRAAFLQLLQKEDKVSLLEIGAGTGKDSRFFADHGLHVTAVDLAENMVALCRQKGLRAQVLDLRQGFRGRTGKRRMRAAPVLFLLHA